MKILYLTQFYSQAMKKALKLTDEYSQAGISKIWIMSSVISSDHKLSILSTGYSKAVNFKWVKRKEETHNVNEKKIKVVYPSYFAFKYLSFLYLVISLTVESLRQKPDVILCCNFRLETMIPALFNKLFSKTKVICEYYDGYHAVYPRWSMRGMLFRLVYSIGKKFSDGFILVNSDLQYEMANKHIAIMPFILQDHKQQDEKVYALEKRDKIRIAYTGRLDDERGVEIFINAARELEDNNRYVFYVSGDGPLKSKVIQSANEIKGLSYLGFMDYDEYIEFINSIDIFVNAQKIKHIFSKYSFPSKVREYIDAGKIIISTEFQDLMDVDALGMYFFKDDDPKDLVNVILSVSKGTHKVSYSRFYSAYGQKSTRSKMNRLLEEIQVA